MTDINLENDDTKETLKWVRQQLVKAWHERGCKEDDQLGVAALLLSDMLGEIPKDKIDNLKQHAGGGQ